LPAMAAARAAIGKTAVTNGMRGFDQVSV